MKKFKDLVHKKHGYADTGTQALMFFDNGYGVSVVRHEFSYGGDKGLYELAVLKGDKNNWDLCYSTPITDDVMGYLSPSEVTDIMAQVQELPSYL